MNYLRRQKEQNISLPQPCRRRTLAVWLGILLFSLFPDPIGIFSGQGGAADLLPALGNCPLTGHSYKAHPASSRLAGGTGEEIILSFALDPPRLPQGFFMSVNLRMIAAPENAQERGKPEILTGFPDTRLVFHSPGIYRYAVVVSMIAKSSCGGVKADTVFSGEIDINVSDSR